MAAANPQPKPPLKLADTTSRGRVFIASRNILPGEILLTESPLLLYPSSSSSSFCSHCFRLLPAAPTPCPLCPTFLFCSSLCLLSSSHSPPICRAISSLDPSLVSQSLFLLSASALSPPNFQILLSLDGGNSASETPHALLLHSLLSPLTGFSLEVTAFLLRMDQRNAFGLMEGFRVRAYGIYPRASFFNHDCLPNACRFDYADNVDIVVRAIHGIGEGGEVCLSYFPTNWGYGERQGRLVEEYGFRCVCDRCEVEKNWKEGDEEEEEDDFPHAYFFVRFVCEREDCGGTLAPLPPLLDGSLSGLVECNVCGQVRKEDGFRGSKQRR